MIITHQLGESLLPDHGSREPMAFVGLSILLKPPPIQEFKEEILFLSLLGAKIEGSIFVEGWTATGDYALSHF